MKVTICIIFLVLVVGCQSNESTVLPTIEVTSTSDVTFAETRIPDNTSEVEKIPSIPFHKISTSRLRNIWWEQDSLSLYYMLQSEEVFLYNLSEETSVQIESSVVAPRTPHPDLLQQLPADAQSISPSPSRNKALYVIPIGPTEKLSEENRHYEDAPVQIWLWEDGQSQLVGEIMDCIELAYGWSANEERVVFASISFFCTNQHYTLLDLNTFTFTPLFQEMDLPEKHCCHLSPDSSRMIFQIDYEPYLLDSVTQEITKIPVPPLIYLGFQWIDDNRLLALYPYIIGEPTSAGILNLDTNSVEEFFSETDAFLEGEKFFRSTVSPNGQWVAFVAGEDFEHIFTVWILRLPDS